MGARSAIYDAAVEAVREIVAAYNRSRDLTQDFAHAREALAASLSKTEFRAAFLEQLAAAHATDQIPREAYVRILSSIARLLKGAADLTAELDRVCATGKH